MSNDPLKPQILAVCDAVGEFIEYWGFKAILGRAWALLAMSRYPLSQTEMAQFLGVSRSLMSSCIAELTARGLVRATSPSRNAPYEAVLDVWPSISEVLRSREWMLLEANRIALEAALDEVELAGERGHALVWHPDRIRFLLKAAETAQAFLRMLIRLRTTPTLEHFGKWLGLASGLMRGLRG